MKELKTTGQLTNENKSLMNKIIKWVPIKKAAGPDNIINKAIKIINKVDSNISLKQNLKNHNFKQTEKCIGESILSPQTNFIL